MKLSANDPSIFDKASSRENLNQTQNVIRPSTAFMSIGRSQTNSQNQGQIHLNQKADTKGTFSISELAFRDETLCQKSGESFGVESYSRLRNR